MIQYIKNSRAKLNNAIKNLSIFERFFAVVFFVIAVLLPLPGTGPTSLALITAYAGYRARRKR